MTFPNSSPQLGEDCKGGFARLAENLDFLGTEDCFSREEMLAAIGELTNRCKVLADDSLLRSDVEEQERQEKRDYGMRMARQRNDLLAVLFSSEGERRKMFEWLCEHSDVPELYRNDYAGT